MLGDEGTVHVCNSDDKTVAFHYADKRVIAPLIYDPSYISFLLEYCKENRIDILLSLFDIDLPILAANKRRFEEIGTHVIVSDPEIVEICNDKWKTYQYLTANNFHTPKTFLTLEQTLLALESGLLRYPIIVKPRFGCGSIAMSVAEDELGLIYYYRRNTRAVNNTYLKYESGTVDEKIIYQEYLHGQEYGADIINDLKGRFQHVNIRKKIAMRAGETDIAELIEEPEIYKELKRLGTLTGHIANMDTDVFLVDGVPYVLEMNARFGGGYPFSHEGGCNLPKAIIDWCNGNTVGSQTLKAHAGAIGYKELYITRGNL